jgi:16S rRNA (guanine527-N7)-methyltransferase
VTASPPSPLSSVARVAPPPPPAAAELFGDRLPLAVRYADRLVSAGVERGLIGPREAERIWQRHLLNSAVLAEALPELPVGLRVLDVGSGAGLPGIPLLLACPGLRMQLVEPLQRRYAFLVETVELLDLPVEVVRARAEELPPEAADVVVARAVAPLARLLALTLPAVRPGGLLLALKGRGAAAELAAARTVLRAWPGTLAEVATVGAAVAPATVVRVERGNRRERGGRR